MKNHQKIGTVAGVTVFLVNILENTVHYNIGRKNGDDKFKFHIPNKKDAAYIILISILAGLIVGAITKEYSKTQ
jgi:hypothetical protein